MDKINVAREVREETRQICVKAYSGAIVNGEQAKNKINSKYPFPPLPLQVPMNRDCRLCSRKYSRGKMETSLVLQAGSNMKQRTLKRKAFYLYQEQEKWKQ